MFQGHLGKKYLLKFQRFLAEYYVVLRRLAQNLL